MNALLTVLALALATAVSLFVEGGTGALVACACFALCAVAAGATVVKDERKFLLQIFVAGLLVRMLVGTIIYALRLQEFFGGDAFIYDRMGWDVVNYWLGRATGNDLVIAWQDGGTGWGMGYLVALIYYLFGRNMLAVQFFNATVGAATAVVCFGCARHLFQNLRVARVTAFAVAFYPSLVLWSAQGLKDGPIVFLLAAAMLATLKLGERFSMTYLLLLASSMLGLLTLRFYIFYMLAAAVGGAFVIGMRKVSGQGMARQLVVVAALGLAFTYFGVLRTASKQYEEFGNLQNVQVRRDALAAEGKSGFGRDVDVSTTSGAISAIPVGMVYLLFAPFPWQLGSLRQSITIPEMAVWWASFPLLCVGLWFTLKHRLRPALPVLIFTSMLTLAYSVFQGNIGTAYRQRSQLLVFYFIFVAVGLILAKERQEERSQRAKEAKRAAIASRAEHAALRRARLKAARERQRPGPPRPLAERVDL
ncbi:MAG TPA: glycosyltransferase family 39 protein [Pyrinomonadaceae bacterium]|nr:glycosyltransferase family 39 protein [Pyrinomonadaceae bacterium]